MSSPDTSIPADRPSALSSRPAHGSSDDDLIAAALEQVGHVPSSGFSSPSGFDPATLRTPAPVSPHAVVNQPDRAVSENHLQGASGLSRFQPDLFPGYTITRELQRGGQGIVYQAIHNTTKRKVAIKVMRDGPFVDPRDKVRFEREIEILSSLNHPNIVAVHDSGVAGGLHYFVMDYVSGQSLDAYLESSEAGPEAIVRMFIKICDAVNAAHLKGVIHRDLKPGNIRVDARGEPHVLDFGLAKSAVGSDTGHNGDPRAPAVMTATGQFIGSLPWASPEQAEGSVAKVDVRTDVYSLGVMMYQALTGRFPYNVLGNMRDALDNILKAEPAKPTARPAARPSTKAGRSTRAVRLDNDVETIVLKCLAKERVRRYQSAGELGRDLQRFLAGEPVEAKRDSGLYVLRKTLTRHKPMLVAGSLIAASVTGAAVVSTYFWRQAAAQRDEVIVQRDLARSATERARAISTALTDTLNLIDPDIAQGRDITVPRAMYAGLAQRAERIATDDPRHGPELSAELLDTAGQAMMALGEVPQAIEYFERAITLVAKLSQADPQGVRAAEAKALEASARMHLAYALIWRQPAGPKQAAEAIAPAEAAVQLRKAAAPVNAGLAQSPQLAEALYILGLAHKRSGDTAKGLELYQQAVAMFDAVGGPPLARMDALSSLGRLQHEQGDIDAAIKSFDLAISLARNAGLGQSFRVATPKRSLAASLRRRAMPEDLDRAVSLAEEIVESYAVLSDDHLLKPKAYNTLGWLLMAQGDFEQAEQQLLAGMRLIKAAAAQAGMRPEEHDAFVSVAINLGTLYIEERKSEAALPLFRASLEQSLRRTSDPEWDQNVLLSRVGLAKALLATSAPAEAERHLLAVADAALLTPVEQRPEYARKVVQEAATLLVDLYSKRGQSTQATKYSPLMQ